MLSIVIFIIVLSVLVLLHELGHYVAARRAGVRVEEFGLGYPPRALQLFKRGTTIFSLNWIPFGGFVRLDGEDAEYDQQKETKRASDDKPFYMASASARLGIILAGVAVNLLVGVVAFSVVYSLVGIPTQLNEARIGQVVSGSPAQEAGVPEQVSITAIRLDDGVVSTPTVDDVINVVAKNRGRELALITTGACQGLECQELSQEFVAYVRTAEETPAGQGALGVVFETNALVFYPWYQMPVRGIGVGLQQTFGLTLLILDSLSQMVREAFGGSVPSDIAGPVGIVHQAQQSGILEQDVLTVVQFAGMISINLAVMNMLPIPALDGGRATFIILEKIVGRKRVSKIEGYANYGGFAVLLALILAITAKDIWVIFAGR